MLILSRKVGERIMIDQTIIVTVLEVQGKRVRLGIQASPGISIRREELPPKEHTGAQLVPEVAMSAGRSTL